MITTTNVARIRGTRLPVGLVGPFEAHARTAVGVKMIDNSTGVSAVERRRR